MLNLHLLHTLSPHNPHFFYRKVGVMGSLITYCYHDDEHMYGLEIECIVVINDLRQMK